MTLPIRILAEKELQSYSQQELKELAGMIGQIKSNYADNLRHYSQALLPNLNLNDDETMATMVEDCLANSTFDIIEKHQKTMHALENLTAIIEMKNTIDEFRILDYYQDLILSTVSSPV